MGGQIAREFFSVVSAIVLLAIIAALVSKNANTAGVTNSLSSAFNTGIATAAGPVTGYSPGPPIYANQGGFQLGALATLQALGGI